ncbi:hypothetical protein F5Y18DRAFT_424260 [Xylariaceae sp. FL1019]|nr:hypothetical protein F5Y18DRAFT_424260 [Xylariaceae sp. FL1019]
MAAPTEYHGILKRDDQDIKIRKALQNAFIGAHLHKILAPASVDEPDDTNRQKAMQKEDALRVKVILKHSQDLIYRKIDVDENTEKGHNSSDKFDFVTAPLQLFPLPIPQHSKGELLGLNCILREMFKAEVDEPLALSALASFVRSLACAASRAPWMAALMAVVRRPSAIGCATIAARLGTPATDV